MNNTIQQPANGRVDILEPELDTKALFTLYDKMPVNIPTSFRDATKGEWNESNLSRAFFSRENVQIIQNIWQFYCLKIYFGYVFLLMEYMQLFKRKVAGLKYI